MSAERATYLDSSALVKLAVDEPESRALRTYLRGRRLRVSSAIVRVEVYRALARFSDEAAQRARAVLAGIELLGLSARVLDAAAAIEPDDIRSLDAIHLATAARFESRLGTFVTYDDLLAGAAEARGFRLAQPR